MLTYFITREFWLISYYRCVSPLFWKKKKKISIGFGRSFTIQGIIRGNFRRFIWCSWWVISKNSTTFFFLLKVEVFLVFGILQACTLAELRHFQYQSAFKRFQCFQPIQWRYLNFCYWKKVYRTYSQSQKDEQTERHVYADSEFDTGEKYIYFKGILKLSFGCCKRFAKVNLPPQHSSIGRKKVTKQIIAGNTNKRIFFPKALLKKKKERNIMYWHCMVSVWYRYIFYVVFR